jgi:hypothetical protein
MTKKRSRPRRRGTRAARSHYDPTPWPGLVGAPFVLLLNLVVITAEDNAKTDGPIPSDAIQTVQALIRQRYDFPDLALDEGQGVGLSMIGQFFHVDDYRELQMDQLHRSQILATLQGEKEEPGLDLKDGDLRHSNLSDPQSLAEGHERALGLWYKQRLLAFYFVGERAQIGRLTQEPPGDELLQNILAVLEQALDLSEKLGIFVYPAFVPAAKMPRVSRQNAMEWARVLKEKLDTGELGAISVAGPPGPSYSIRRKKE